MAKKIDRGNSDEVSQKKASTAFKVGDCLSRDSNGFLVPGGSGKIVGISNEVVTSADSDYASTRDLNYTQFNQDDEFEFPVITGSATQTLVGELVDIDASDARGVDVTASSNDQVLVTRIISTTVVWGKFVVQTS